MKKDKDFFQDFDGERRKNLLISEKRLTTLKIVILILFLVLISRLAWITIVQGEFWQDVALTNKIRIEKIKAPRGLIYSEEGTILTQNVPTFYLAITPADLSKDKKERNKLLDELIKIIPQEINYDSQALEMIRQAPSHSYQRIVLAQGLTYEQFIYLKTKLADWPGINILPTLQRKYPQGEIFSHLIGYLGKISPQELEKDPYYSINDFYPKAGVEKEYENYLRGQDGQKKIEVDSYGQEQKLIAQQKPKKGKDITLTINSALQEKIAQLLKKHLEKLGLSKGTVIALNPKTGEVLAAFSLPNYDNNIFIWGDNEEKQAILLGEDSPLVFRAIAGLYPSGSIIKGAIAAGALEEGVIEPETEILSQGGISVGQWFFPDWKAGGHGRVNVIEALANSVNTFFYYIGGGYGDFQGLGVDGINQYLSLFGFGEKTGIDIPGEASGLLPTPLWKEARKGEPWYPGDTYHLSIGQGDILVTPLQVANYTAAIANGGTLFRPYLLSSIEGETEPKEIKKSEIIRTNFISQENLEIVRQGFRAVVEEGSGRYLQYFEPKVAGKTGTAEVANKKPHAWFTCFAPYEDPEIVLTVLIENGGEGSEVAIPLAKEILTWYFEF